MTNFETLLNISVADNCETGDKIHTITYKQIDKQRLNNNLIIQLTTLTTFKHIYRYNWPNNISRPARADFVNLSRGHYKLIP